MLGSRSVINVSPTLNATVNTKALTNGKPELVLSKGTVTDICCPVSTGVHLQRLLIPSCLLLAPQRPHQLLTSQSFTTRSLRGASRDAELQDLWECGTKELPQFTEHSSH